MTWKIVTFFAIIIDLVSLFYTISGCNPQKEQVCYTF